MLFRFRDSGVAKKIVERLKEMNLDIRVMHVCGTHQDTLVRFGLDELFSSVGVEVRQGPGCPVCVTTPFEIAQATTLARCGKTVVTFGDMAPVPSVGGSLLDARAEGCDVRIVYSVEEAVKVAKREPQRDVVFFAVGFETTAPTTAAALLSETPPNFYVLSAHRLIPPAMEALLRLGELRIDGFINPGHVSTIIGTTPYERISAKYRVPQVVAGFEPLDMMMGIYMLARQIKEGRCEVENEYSRVVRADGNVKAQNMMREVFSVVDTKWRGLPEIPESGLSLRRSFEEHDASKAFEDELKELLERKAEFKEPTGCRCGEILRGLIYPEECPLFAKRCTPESPVGPCMVSREGSCNIFYKYRRK
ncbi:hydrogenase formation protein HypD [Candidatus Alkanophaga liquidiphilum]|nr:Hydrogenase maturation factor HypD [Candidatus Alkanophaga liquidiphilum]